jgi:BCD family chlorophyll transporter-like MFS transporter
MGLWGASQAIAFGGGGFLGTVLADLAKLLVGSSGSAYALVFGLEVVGFVVAAWLALGIAFGKPVEAGRSQIPVGQPVPTDAVGQLAV